MSYFCTSFAPAGRQAIRISPRLLVSFTHLTTRLAFCILLFSVSIPAYAQPASCCQSLRTQGQTAFNNKDYAKAITHWTNGKGCSDASKCPDLDALIQKAKTEQQKQKAAAATAERQRVAAEQERQRAAAAERQRIATEQERQRKAAEAQAAYNLAKRLNTKEAYQAFIEDYKTSTLVADARKRIAEIDKPNPAITTPSPTTPAAPSGMALIRGGTFQMGDVMGDKEQTDETVHTVTVSDFYLGRYEVTFDEYDAFCDATGRTKPSDQGWGRGQRPVINVSWLDAAAYCNWLSEKEKLSKVYTISGDKVSANWNAIGYRLPTEAEWEYAARGGGKKVRFGNGKDVADPAAINFDASASYKKPYSIAGEYRERTVPVGSLNSPNALGLHDMSGNVWEWCWDWYGSYSTAPETNPTGPASGSVRVFRGGSWRFDPQGVRVADRNSYSPGLRFFDLGFRLSRAVK